MAVTAKLFSNFPHLLLEDGLLGSILAQTIKVALFTSDLSAHLDQDANQKWGVTRFLFCGGGPAGRSSLHFLIHNISKGGGIIR